MEKLNPQFSLKYIRGLGDVITYILHGSPLSWITYNIFKLKEPCGKCLQRAVKLNAILPLPVWRLFFKDKTELIKKLSEELEKTGFKVNVSDDYNSISSTKIIKQSKLNEKNKEYALIGSSHNHIGDLLIKTEIYKKQ